VVKIRVWCLLVTELGNLPHPKGAPAEHDPDAAVCPTLLVLHNAACFRERNSIDAEYEPSAPIAAVIRSGERGGVAHGRLAVDLTALALGCLIPRAAVRGSFYY
jgi:hypothetical protein